MLRKIVGRVIRYLAPPKTKQEEILEKAMRLLTGYGPDWLGDYLEFGVGKGGASFVTAYQLARHYGLGAMHFYAFDSFQGLPPIRGVDAEVPQFQEGMYACSHEQFITKLRRGNVDLGRVTTVPGWYHETLNAATKRTLPNLKRASIVWVDCDLYASTVAVLDFVTDYVMDGTIIIFDDWFCFRGSPQRGEQRAFREWLAKNPSITASEYYKYGFDSNSFILHRH